MKGPTLRTPDFQTRPSATGLPSVLSAPAPTVEPHWGEWCDLCTRNPDGTESRNLRTRASWFHPQHWVSECGWLLSMIKLGRETSVIWVRRSRQKEGKIANMHKLNQKTLSLLPFNRQRDQLSLLPFSRQLDQAWKDLSWLLQIQKDSCPNQEGIFLCSVTLIQATT